MANEQLKVNIGDALVKCVTQHRITDAVTATLSIAALSYSQTETISGKIKFIVPSTVTSGWIANQYPYSITVLDGNNNRSTVETGVLTVLPDPTTSTTITLTYNETILAAIRARIAERSTTDQNSMAIANRSVGRMSKSELMSWEAEFAWRVYLERNNNKLPVVKNNFGRY